MLHDFSSVGNGYCLQSLCPEAVPASPGHRSSCGSLPHRADQLKAQGALRGSSPLSGALSSLAPPAPCFLQPVSSVQGTAGLGLGSSYWHCVLDTLWAATISVVRLTSLVSLQPQHTPEPRVLCVQSKSRLIHFTCSLS